ncbi:MAG: hypothetical protein HY858_15260 [Candidatus Solibacter usitatus]|nr:hypothetical protein [Candidatus Solibacter usitatus]
MKPAAIAAACVGVALAYLSANVTLNHAGNWTALFVTGDAVKAAPEELLRSETLAVTHGSPGYDGQFYHYMAHDPWGARGFDSHIDDPGYRYRRILMPALAWCLALGRDRWIDYAYIAVVLLAIALGCCWTSRLALNAGRSAWWGAAFLVLPATLSALERMTVDVGVAALCCGWALYRLEGRGKPLLAIACLAPAVRETGGLLCLAQLDRGWRWLWCMAPAAAWCAWTRWRYGPSRVEFLGPLPFEGWWQRLTHPAAYPFSRPVNEVLAGLDLLALVAFPAAWALVAWCVRKRESEWPALALFALVPAFTSTGGVWVEANAFARSFTPLFLLLGAQALRSGRWLFAIPVAMVAPRVWMEMVSPLYQIVLRTAAIVSSR